MYANQTVTPASALDGVIARLSRIVQLLEVEIPTELREATVGIKTAILLLQQSAMTPAATKLLELLSVESRFRKRVRKDGALLALRPFLLVCQELRTRTPLTLREISRTILVIDETVRFDNLDLKALRTAGIVERVTDTVKANIPHRLTAKGLELIEEHVKGVC